MFSPHLASPPLLASPLSSPRLLNFFFAAGCFSASVTPAPAREGTCPPRPPPSSAPVHYSSKSQPFFTKQTLTSLLKSCSTHPNQLKQVHTMILTTGLSPKNSLVTQMLSNFILFGDLIYARKLFDEMYKPRIYLWNVLVKGYVKNELPFDAACVYNQMHCDGIRPDEFTYPFVIKACTQLGEVLTGEAVHAHVVKYGLGFVSMVRTELIVMYVKFGELGLADLLFETMGDRDLVAWNAFISACVQSGYAAKGLSLFRQMGFDGVKFDVVTLVNALSICGHLGCLEIGEETYETARKTGIEFNIIVDNARLDMYVKCGNVDTARDLFEKMPSRNVISWSTMIVGYAINGESEKALTLFSKMQSYGVKPNYVTYLGVLSACSHAGLVREGRAYFNRMAKSNDKDIKPRKEHYACMVDLLGRSGNLIEAYDLAKSMPIEPDPAVWGALLGACAIHQNVELGNRVADLIFEMSSDIASYHVLLSNMYAASGRWDRVDKLRLRMRKKGVKKTAGYSSVEYKGEINIFYVGDRSHPQSATIYDKLDDLLKQIKSIGYSPGTCSALHDVEMEEKEVSLSTHSEKLAIAFGLINVKREYPIRVMKNLRTCEDCHMFAKFVSRVTSRDIIMRDKNRFHHFRNGVCSCKDFW